MVLYDITCLGFIEETYNPIINGVVEAIARAHDSMVDGRAFYSEVPIEDFGINRSPASYLANPESERRRYKENIDRNLQQIKFVNAQDEIIGAFHWVASKSIVEKFNFRTVFAITYIILVIDGNKKENYFPKFS